MGITNSNKVLSQQKMSCRDTVKVTLALTAAPDILTNPTDIALVLDRSGSMQGATLENMKMGAKTFIDIIAESTGGAGSGQIGSGSRIGVVSFSDTAVDNTPLITSTETLKEAVDSLVAAGSTNHADAFATAAALFDYSSANARVIVLFTDGKTTSGPPPAPVAAATRAKGVTIYCIGLLGTDGIDVNALNEWASDPDTAHVAVTPSAEDLEKLFAELALNISKTGATNVVIHEVLEPDFAIDSVLPPNYGTATVLDSHSLRWNIPALGVTGSESAVLEFLVRHTADDPGTKLVNRSITYSDKEGNVVSFPQPVVSVECNWVVQPEKCPEPVSFTVEGCEDSVVLDMGSICQSGWGELSS